MLKFLKFVNLKIVNHLHKHAFKIDMSLQKVKLLSNFFLGREVKKKKWHRKKSILNELFVMLARKTFIYNNLVPKPFLLLFCCISNLVVLGFMTSLRFGTAVNTSVEK